jgi:hypothetical protein
MVDDIQFMCHKAMACVTLYCSLLNCFLFFHWSQWYAEMILKAIITSCLGIL